MLWKFIHSKKTFIKEKSTLFIQKHYSFNWKMNYRRWLPLGNWSGLHQKIPQYLKRTHQIIFNMNTSMSGAPFRAKNEGPWSPGSHSFSYLKTGGRESWIWKVDLVLFNEYFPFRWASAENIWPWAKSYKRWLVN